VFLDIKADYPKNRGEGEKHSVGLIGGALQTCQLRGQTTQTWGKNCGGQTTRSILGGMVGVSPSTGSNRRGMVSEATGDLRIPIEKRVRGGSENIQWELGGIKVRSVGHGGRKLGQVGVLSLMETAPI